VVSGDTEQEPIEYHWSFGDGTAAYREAVDHQYAFPGTYNVVATVRQGSEEAVARTVITVVEPALAIRAGNDGNQAYVELKNNSNYEVNVGNWQLGDGKKNIILPEDTILNGSDAVKIPFLTMPNELSLAAPSGRIYAETNTQSAALALLVRQLRSLAPPQTSPPAEDEVAVVPVVLETATIESPPVATATAVELPSEPSWWQKLWHEIF
jgi:PKD repeat protein